jgi:hypothetical protein
MELALEQRAVLGGLRPFGAHALEREARLVPAVLGRATVPHAVHVADGAAT